MVSLAGLAVSGNLPSDKERILAYLRTHGSITPLDALRAIGSFRLGARIWDLRHEGWDIETTTFETEGGSRVARYVLHEKDQLEIGL